MSLDARLLLLGLFPEKHTFSWREQVFIDLSLLSAKKCIAKFWKKICFSSIKKKNPRLSYFVYLVNKLLNSIQIAFRLLLQGKHDIIYFLSIFILFFYVFLVLRFYDIVMLQWLCHWGDRICKRTRLQKFKKIYLWGKKIKNNTASKKYY